MVACSIALTYRRLLQWLRMLSTANNRRYLDVMRTQLRMWIFGISFS